MSFIARLQRACEIGDEDLDELVDVQQVARREGKVRVWAGTAAARPAEASDESQLFEKLRPR